MGHTGIRGLAGVKVLCVDDDADMLHLLSVTLGRHGAEVTTCSSAEAAIVCLRTHHFDVIVSDLRMPPGLDGYDLAHALRKMERENPGRRGTPAVAVSGDAMMPSTKRRFADFQVYMRKPVDREQLVHVVARLVEADGAAIALGSLDSWEAAECLREPSLSTR